MSWDDIFKSLITELGREPDSGEVQERMLEIVTDSMDRERIASTPSLIITSPAIPLKKGA